MDKVIILLQMETNTRVNFKMENIMDLSTFSSGNKYLGEFQNGKYHGQGTYYYLADDDFKEDLFTGKYKDNKRNGYGVYTHANGNVYKGEYQNVDMGKVFTFMQMETNM